MRHFCDHDGQISLQKEWTRPSLRIKSAGTRFKSWLNCFNVNFAQMSCTLKKAWTLFFLTDQIRYYSLLLRPSSNSEWGTSLFTFHWCPSKRHEPRFSYRSDRELFPVAETKFKFWMRYVVVPFSLMPFGKAWTLLFLQIRSGIIPCNWYQAQILIELLLCSCVKGINPTLSVGTHHLRNSQPLFHLSAADPITKIPVFQTFIKLKLLCKYMFTNLSVI